MTLEVALGFVHSVDGSPDWYRAFQVVDRQNKRELYQMYLRSQEWGHRRAKTLTRAGNLCEGCREQTALEVHHITYDHIGAEFLFELRGLCKWCHDAISRGEGSDWWLRESEYTLKKRLGENRAVEIREWMAEWARKHSL